MPDRIPLSAPSLDGATLAYLRECVETTYVSAVGPFVDRFEREFARFVGSRFAVACASGTAALHVALRLAGIGPGDEVFVSTLTFVASANPVVYERATPVLVDCDRATWNLDPDLVAEELDRRARGGRPQPKAVVAVHILGQPANLEPLLRACERHGVPVIEDAAEALGAEFAGGRLSGRQVGTAGRMGCYSFNGNKIITCGGGGMIATDDEALARRAKHLTCQAKLPGPEYRHDDVGYNYRLTNLAAALGVAQLERLPEFLRRKRDIADRYDRAFRNVPGIALPPRLPWSRSTYWLYTLGVDPRRFGSGRNEILGRLQESGIESRPIWTPLHLLEPYRTAPRLGGAVAEELFETHLSLPSSVGLTPDQQDRVIAGVLASRRVPA